MGWLSAVMIAYGLLNIVLGLAGWFGSQSLPSLIAGVAAGLIVLVGAALAKTHRFGYILVGIVCLAILGRFFKLAFLELKIYPAMILAIASILTLICLAYGHLTTPKTEAAP
jgi:uncharacterized membrane protein (UPF0136 family)